MSVVRRRLAFLHDPHLTSVTGPGTYLALTLAAALVVVGAVSAVLCTAVAVLFLTGGAVSGTVFFTALGVALTGVLVRQASSVIDGEEARLREQADAAAYAAARRAVSMRAASFS